MKKSKAITLVLVTALLGCKEKRDDNSWGNNRLYMRTDSTGTYTHARNGFIGYYIFRPYGMFYGGRYMRQGYSNAGVHMSEASITRGGFGRSGGFHVSS
ncbi:hypothetical protein [Mucilaginibacter sp.]|uniref:hypothetical protein n=1 Tax=Mucilaginibacter sp. TaxID=1882438 RepID=UPI00260E853A|nr:hypothetical protein [Mucilaginibacter sp.]MDB4927065.1 hypothetical protein [Mucilaginibacter sp.]